METRFRRASKRAPSRKTTVEKLVARQLNLSKKRSLSPTDAAHSNLPSRAGCLVEWAWRAYSDATARKSAAPRPDHRFRRTTARRSWRQQLDVVPGRNELSLLTSRGDLPEHVPERAGARPAEVNYAASHSGSSAPRVP
jgi:hypothetical protein